MIIKYDTVDNFIGWELCESYVSGIILSNKIKSILEIGAGANPTLNPDFIRKHNLSYTISDVDNEELNKADELYSKRILDLSKRNFDLTENYDFVFSRMVGEHITNGKIFHQNVFKILNNGGLSFHCFSTLYAFPFLINRILPEKISSKLLKKISPRDDHKHGKFPAHYKWCRGPSRKMINNYLSIGYEIVEYTGYFGHNYYKKISLLNSLEKFKSELLIKLRVPHLNAYASVLLKKPV